MLKVRMGGRPQAEPGFGMGGGSRCDGEVGGELRIRESVVRSKILISVKSQLSYKT